MLAFAIAISKRNLYWGVFIFMIVIECLEIIRLCFEYLYYLVFIF